MSDKKNRPGLWCPWAEHAINVSISGNIGSCCWQEPIKDRENRFINIEHYTITEAFNSKEFQQIRNNLNNGIQDPHCVNCWNLENLGNRSIRSDEVENEGEYYDDVEGLLSISLDLSNLCNLKCRTCNQIDSTMWIQETRDVYFKDIKLQTQFKNYSRNLFKYDKFVEDLFGVTLHSVKELNFKGGEPFLIKEQWKIIDYLIDNGYTDKVVSYHTNGTIWDQEKQDKLSKFSVVGLCLSIDDIGPRFEYLRHPAKWDHVKNNILSIKKWRDSEPEKRLMIFNTVVSSYNILTISEIIDFGEENGIIIKLHPTMYPNYFSIVNLPKSLKDQAVKNLKAKTWSDHYQQEVDLVINLLENSTDDPALWQEFLEFTQRHDDYRKEDFKVTFPELWNSIKSSMTKS